MTTDLTSMGRQLRLEPWLARRHVPWCVVRRTCGHDALTCMYHKTSVATACSVGSELISCILGKMKVPLGQCMGRIAGLRGGLE